MKIKTIHTVFTVALLFTCSSAEAGSVQFKSDSWDNIPIVEFCQGLNAPQQCDISDTYYDVEREFVYVGEDKVCYRRSADPSNADSVLNAWTCAVQIISGTYTYSLN